MKRYTKKVNNIYVVSSEVIKKKGDNYTGDAIERLAIFENMVDDILLKQEEITRALAELRNKKETKIFRFKELLGNKLINSAIINVFKNYHLI
ncbi:MAG: hypothetical protein ACOXZS_02130 [Bacilli bacterium]